MTEERPRPLESAQPQQTPEEAVTAWLAGNDEYLSRSLTWLRLMLARTAERSRAEAGKPGAAEPVAGHLEPEPEPGPAEEISPPAAEATAQPPLPRTVIQVRPEPAPGHRWSWRRRAGTAPTPVVPDPAAAMSGPPTLAATPARPELVAGPGTGDPLPSPPAEQPESAPDHEPPSGGDLDLRIASAAAAVREAAALDPPPALERVAALFGLTVFEREVLLLCVAPALDTGFGRLIEDAHGSSWPTFALAMATFDDPAWDSQSPDRPLRRWRLVEAAGSGPAMISVALAADERIVNAVKGVDHLDERLATLLDLVPPATTALPASQRAIVDSVVGALVRSAPAARPPLIQLVGSRPGTRTAIAAAIAAAVERDLYRLAGRQLPASPAEMNLIARLWFRESALAPVALFLDEDDRAERAGDPVLSAFLGRTGGLLLLGGRDVLPDLPVPSHVVDVATPAAAEQRAAWRQALGPDTDVDVGPLVGQFDLDGDTIAAVVRLAGTAGQPASTGQLWDQARSQLRPRLESVAQRVTPLATWDSIVLPDSELTLLHQIAAQVPQRSTVYGDWGFGDRMNRGLGISALFTGESGTGKSMAAEVIANELRLDLYRIDLSSVVSKYIGETEKNLSRLFDAAEEGGVILFFDEADALFGRRSEVRDAHDRYANIEVNFLLQRMETYRGLAILATNMRTALDRAFTRRLRFVVTFPFPRPADRVRIWELAFPPAVPLDHLDLQRLSRIDLTGAGIANAALNAAFLAAAADRQVGMADVLAAARDELRKLQRPVNEADFRLAMEVHG